MHNEGVEWVVYNCSIPHHCGALYQENMISKTTKYCKSLVWYDMILQAPQQQFKSNIAVKARHFHITFAVGQPNSAAMVFWLVKLLN